jgi:hypothetical protein
MSKKALLIFSRAFFMPADKLTLQTGDWLVVILTTVLFF